MIPRRGITVPTMLGILLCVYCLWPSAFLAAQANQETSLRAQYEKKVFMLRSFYADNELEYDSSGAIRRNPTVGPWTLARVQIDHLKFKKQRLELGGIRIGNMYNRELSKFVPISTHQHVHISIDRDPSLSSSPETALARVFLGESEKIEDSVPSYWKAFAERRVELKSGSRGNTLYTIRRDGVAPAKLPSKVLRDITAPKPITTPDPRYGEIARSLHYQGTTMLYVEVTEQGAADNIQIVRPLGLGLDDQAVEAVKTWKFTPAQKDGQPVRVLINVEVHFKLE